jgi:hypothetical protein
MDAVGAAGARLASPTLHVLNASCFSIGAGMRTALAGAVRHPSVIDSEWTRVRSAIRSGDGRARSRDPHSPQRTWMTERRWPVIRGPGDGWRSWDPLGDDVGRWSSRSRGSRDDGRHLRRSSAWGTRVGVGQLSRVPRYCYGEKAQSPSRYAAEPSRNQPSSWAGSLSCWPRNRGTTRKRQSTSGREVMSLHSFSYCEIGKTSS